MRHNGRCPEREPAAPPAAEPATPGAVPRLVDQACRLTEALDGLPAAQAPIARLRGRASSHEGGQRASPLGASVRESEIASIVSELADLGRAAIIEAFTGHETACAAAVRELEANAAWARLSRQDRDRLLGEHELLPDAPPSLASAESVLDSLAATSLAQWAGRRSAVRSQTHAALAAAEQGVADPQAQVVRLPSRSIGSVGELDAYLDSIRRLLSAALDEHESILVRGP